MPRLPSEPGPTRREVALGGLAAAALSALPWRAAVAQGDATTAILATVDPELRPYARRILVERRTPVSRQTLDLRRAAARQAKVPTADAPAISRHAVSAGGGDPDVTVFVVNARAGTRRPAIVHMHGGGFVFGAAQAGLPALQRLAAAIDCVIVTVDYRLAPEVRVAGSTRDTHAALRWTHREAAALGIDPARIAVMGESAGGGHAALLAQIAHDRGDVPVAFQLLVYPMLDDRTGSSRPAPPGAGRLVWTAVDNRFGWQSFLGMPPGDAAVPAGSVPGRRIDLRGLPPAFIAVGSIDLFAGEDIVYAHRLIDAGVPTELHVLPGAFHAFDAIAPDTAVSRRFQAMKIDALRRAFA